jgi:hypothetical protein
LPKSFPAAELEVATGAAPVQWRPVRSGGYGTNSAHWLVELTDGRRAFVKVALDDTAVEWLRSEHLGNERRLDRGEELGLPPP